MQKANVDYSNEELLRVLAKGMVTIPKAWRDDLGFREGQMIKAKKIDKQIVIEPVEKPAPYRVYSQSELKQFLKDDILPKKLSQKINRKFSLKDD